MQSAARRAAGGQRPAAQNPYEAVPCRTSQKRSRGSHEARAKPVTYFRPLSLPRLPLLRHCGLCALVHHSGVIPQAAERQPQPPRAQRSRPCSHVAGWRHPAPRQHRPRRLPWGTHPSRRALRLDAHADRLTCGMADKPCIGKATEFFASWNLRRAAVRQGVRGFEGG